MTILHLVTSEGHFLCGDTELRVTAYAPTGTPQAEAAKASLAATPPVDPSAAMLEGAFRLPDDHPLAESHNGQIDSWLAELAASVTPAPGS